VGTFPLITGVTKSLFTEVKVLNNRFPFSYKRQKKKDFHIVPGKVKEDLEHAIRGILKILLTHRATTRLSKGGERWVILELGGLSLLDGQEVTSL